VQQQNELQQWGSGGSGTGPADQQNPPTEPNTPWSTTASSRQKASDEARRSRSPTPSSTGNIAAAVFSSKVFSDQSAAAPPPVHSHARQPTALMAEVSAGNTAGKMSAEVKRQNDSAKAMRQSLTAGATSPTGRATSYSAQRSPARVPEGAVEASSGAASSFVGGVAALAAKFGRRGGSGGGSAAEELSAAAAVPTAAAGARQHRHKDSNIAQDRYLKAIAPTVDATVSDAPVGGAVLGALSGGTGGRRHSDGAAGQQAKAMEEEAAAAAEAAAAGATAAAAVVASRASSRQLLAGRSRSTMDPEDVQFSDVSWCCDTLL
jgi:hypothetical protein